MKKIITSLLFSFFCFTASFAQIPNPDFEGLNSDGSVSNWGNVYLFSFTLDTNGNMHHTDSIIFDNYLYFAGADAHSGNTAMEMRNAWNFTTNTGIAGGVFADEDSIFSGFAGSEMFDIQSDPVNFNFYSKYFPVNGDTAMAHIMVFDTLGFEIGNAMILLTDTVSSYTYFTTPVNYFLPGPAAYAAISFRTFYTDAQNKQPSFGTRLIVDDVSIDYITGIISANEKDKLYIYPNPASDFISISTDQPVLQITVSDLSGRLVFKTDKLTIDVSSMAAGVYNVNIQMEDAMINRLMIKK